MKRIFLVLLAVSMTALFAGCNSSTTTPVGTDYNKVEVANLVVADESADPNLAGFSLTDEPELAAGEIPGFASPLAAIPDSIKVCWYRHLSNTDKVTSVSGDSTLETVTLNRTNVGALRGMDCTAHHGAHPDTSLFDKAYSVTWTRVAQFSKVATINPDNEDSTRWKLQATSLAFTTQNSPITSTPVIQSVTITGRDTLGAPLSVIFTDPSALYSPATLPWFSPGDTVHIRIVTHFPATQVAFLHFDMASSDRGRCQRAPLRYVAASHGFEGVFPVARPHGGMHANGGRRVRTAVWLDVLTKDTFRDTTAPYAATGWGIPYRLVRPHGPGMMAAR